MTGVQTCALPIFNKRKLLPATTNKEIHHIIPKSLGGSNEKENLVCLTIREHYIAHLLLIKMCVSNDDRYKMVWAFHRTFFSRKLNSKFYEFARLIWINNLKANHHSKRIEGWSEKLSLQTKKSWQGDIERKIKTSNRLKELHEKRKSENSELYYNDQKNRATNASKKRKEKYCKKLEYKGSIYIGYSELLRQTKITKDLYNKYYLNGIDPELRLNSDGSVSIDTLYKMLDQYSILHFRNNILTTINDMKNKNIISSISMKKLINHMQRKENQ